MDGELLDGANIACSDNLVILVKQERLESGRISPGGILM